jgi:hypothetical protein
MNRFVWDLRYPDATRFPGLIMWAGNVRGPRIVPGKYQVRLTVDGQTQTQQFMVKKDPRTPTTPEDFQKQLALALQIRDKLSQANEGVIKIREAKLQLEKYAGSDNKAVAEAAKGFSKQLTAVEEEFIRLKTRAIRTRSISQSNSTTSLQRWVVLSLRPTLRPLPNPRWSTKTWRAE